jgi:hypothetical protein
MYKKASGTTEQTAGTGAGSSAQGNGGTAGAGSEKVVDAEFEEVDKDKK